MQNQVTKTELSSLSPEILQHISFFIRPRHLYKAIQTSKGMKNMLDREEYWARVGVHAIYRHFDFVESMWASKKEHVPGMYAMYNLDMSYYDAMNLFISNLRVGMDTAGPQWRMHKDDSCVDLVRLGVNVMIYEHKRRRAHEKFPAYAECCGDVKKIVQSDVHFMTYESDTPCKLMTRQFQRSIMDDESIPSAAKKAMIEKFSNYFKGLEELQKAEEAGARPLMSYHNLAYCVSHFI
jgi:hypothetical protein